MMKKKLGSAHLVDAGVFFRPRNWFAGFCPTEAIQIRKTHAALRVEKSIETSTETSTDKNFFKKKTWFFGFSPSQFRKICAWQNWEHVLSKFCGRGNDTKKSLKPSKMIRFFTQAVFVRSFVKEFFAPFILKQSCCWFDQTVGLSGWCGKYRYTIPFEQ